MGTLQDRAGAHAHARRLPCSCSYAEAGEAVLEIIDNCFGSVKKDCRSWAWYCRHFDRQYEDAGCGNPKQVEFDGYHREELSRDADASVPRYGAYGGVLVDEGYVCDLWEGKPPKGAAVDDQG